MGSGYSRLLIRILFVAVLCALLGGVPGCGREHEQRVFILGIDGATFDLIVPWVREGRLPNFARVMDAGTATVLKSTIPPSTAVAWTSAVTGVSPGGHGIFGSNKETRLEGDGYVMIPNTSADRRAPAVWQMANEAGKKAVAVNIPLTGPAESIDGAMIAGAPYPADPGDLVYPRDLDKKLGGYRPRLFAEGPKPGEEGLFLADVEEEARRRLDLALSLMENQEWDLFWVVFDAVESVQRYFWKYTDRFHPAYTEEGAGEYGQAILEAYTLVDGFIGEIDAKLPRGSTLIIMSAYGYGPVYRRVYGRSVVEGYCEQATKLSDLAAFGIVPVDPLGASFRIVRAGGAPEGEDAGDAGAAFRNYFRERLLNLRDKHRASKVVSDCHLGREIYEGRYMDLAPDVVGIEEGPYLFSNLDLPDDMRIIELADDPTFPSGFHRQSGVLIMRGRGTERGRLDVRGKASSMGARIEDLVPTILARLRVAAGEALDGRDLSRL